MAFNIPAVSNISRRKPVTSKTWVRPADWVSITGVSSGQIIFLVCDIYTSKVTIDFTKTGVGNVTIDWGDGLSDTYASSTSATHTYTSGGTASTRGYNTWKITMSAAPGNVITAARPIANSEDYASINIGLLEAWYGDGTITNANALFANVVFKSTIDIAEPAPVIADLINSHAFVAPPRLPRISSKL